MRPVNEWLDEYAGSHQNPTNKLLHWICVPVIVISVIGMLWALPVPAVFDRISPALNWGTAMLVMAVVYYLFLSVPLALGMIVVSLAVTSLLRWLDSHAVPLWQLSLVAFANAWVGQFVGHQVEGRKPSFLKDVQFLLIGPLWLLGHVYRRLGWRV